MRALGTLLMMAAIACGDDDAGARVADSDAARPDAGVDAGVDARVASDLDAHVMPRADAAPAADLDAALASDASQATQDGQSERDPDAHVVLADASSACPLTGGGIRYFFDGGFVNYESTYTVTAEGVFQRERIERSRADAGAESCIATLPACGSSAVDGADLGAALLAADVQAAFTSDESVVLGHDERPVDGSVLVVERADKKRITVGNTCSSDEAGCTPIPAGVLNLTTLLFQLSSEQASSGPCISMRI